MSASPKKDPTPYTSSDLYYKTLDGFRDALGQTARQMDLDHATSSGVVDAAVWSPAQSAPTDDAARARG